MTGTDSPAVRASITDPEHIAAGNEVDYTVKCWRCGEVLDIRKGVEFTLPEPVEELDLLGVG